MTIFILVIFFQHLEVITIRDSKSSIIAEKNDLLTVHYQGLLNDSTEFDNSFTSGQPISFNLGVGKVIKGWDIGLSGMKKSEVRKLVIPPHLAYGNKKIGPIPAKSTLIFIVEMLDIKKSVQKWEIPENTKKIITTNASYYDIKPGTGKIVKNGMEIHYHYSLFNKNNEKIYSSYDQNDQKQLVVGDNKHMIKGFENAILGMRVGGKRKIICKDEFGSEGDLFIFDIDLIKAD